ncbi:hypothetical protein JNM05_15275 [bacterium]|nr:hypothetical protein [bacterium]
MSIIFDDCELIAFLDAGEEAPIQGNASLHDAEDDRKSSDNEKLLLSLYRRLSADQQRKILSHIRHVLESVHDARKVNLLKAIEDSKHAAAQEALSDIIKDIVK